MKKTSESIPAYCVETETGQAGHDAIVLLRSILPSLILALSDDVATAPASTGQGPLGRVAAVLERLARRGRRSARGKDRLDPRRSDHEKRRDDRIAAALKAGEPVDLMLRIRGESRSTFWSSLRLRPIASGGRRLEPGGLPGLSTVRPTEVARDAAAGLDVATGCLGRQAFVQAIEGRLKKHAGPAMVVKVDISGFHDINVGYGVDVADALLRETGRRLRVTGAAAVGRVGSDEFALAFDLSHKACGPRIAAGVSEALSRDFAIPGTCVAMRFAVGYAVGDAHGDATSLIRKAGLALRSAKSDPLGGPRRSQSADEKEALLRIRMDRELALALANDEFVWHFQPRIDLSTGGCVGAEAQLRRRHPLFGIQAPGRLVEAAERTGQLLDLGERGLAAVAAFALRVNQGRDRPLRCSVNVSAAALAHGDVAGTLDRIVRRTGAEPAWLTLEITEEVFLGLTPGVLDALRRLRELGVGLSIDDFAMGYANIRLLEILPVTEIKIDPRLVGGLDVSPSRIRVVRNIIEFGRSVGLAVVAEGVETETHRAFLASMGCSLGQGALFGAPVDADRFEAALDGHDDTFRADAGPSASARSGVS